MVVLAANRRKFGIVSSEILTLVASGSRRIPRLLCGAGLWALIGGGLSACHTTAQTVALSVVSATVIGTRSVGSEIQQTYYLGVFDPQGQVPTQVYRLRVHGQGSAIGFTKFASGWVPAAVADSLGSNINFDKDTANVLIAAAGKDQAANLTTGRRLMLFGPQGFREAPADHRLVIVMGSDPSAYFQGIEQALGQASSAGAKQSNAGLSQTLLKALLDLNAEQTRLNRLSTNLDKSIPADKAPVP
jgi:hypothetical protein